MTSELTGQRVCRETTAFSVLQSVKPDSLKPVTRRQVSAHSGADHSLPSSLMKHSQPGAGSFEPGVLSNIC